jgi:hypothetical protein
MVLKTLGRSFMYDVSYNTFGTSTPSSHEMRYKTFLGSVAVLIHTYKRGEVSNPLGVSLEAQA